MHTTTAQNATEELTRLEMAFDDVKRQLFDRLHGILRAQLFPVNASAAEREKEKEKEGGNKAAAQGNGVPPSLPKS